MMNLSLHFERVAVNVYRVVVGNLFEYWRSDWRIILKCTLKNSCSRGMNWIRIRSCGRLV
jgi:hypothetical protein